MNADSDDGSTISDVAIHLRRLRAASSEKYSAARALGEVLVGGHHPGAIARAAGITIAQQYVVMAITVHHSPTRPVSDQIATAATADRIKHLETALASTYGERALPLLGPDGGTLVLADNDFDAQGPHDLFTFLVRNTGEPITATVVQATVSAIPRATDLAHDLLEIVQRLGYGARLYDFDDLVLEYQLTRPGQANERLRTLLSPILEHRDLVETLRQHIANHFSRQATARALHVHSNTIDYRLRRIKELTGMDPYQTTGLWYLQSALIAHTYHTAGPRISK
ncbi:PucR family transcriptional regulator [Nocardia vinacea]|uniref:PucR family transcriptional regulator n=1 Tax=Nocardia vinacea TaxID=96468 RepID=UPI0002D4DF84|nr:helix-turn-helix domain-containing protein [Nocardia vinacea]